MSVARTAGVAFVVGVVSVAVLVLAFLFLLFLLVLVFDPGFLLHGLQPERVFHQLLQSRLFLLLDSKQWVLPDLCCGVSSVVGILNGNEVLVRSANLEKYNP